MTEPETTTVFAFVSLRPCGCVVEVASLAAVLDVLADKKAPRMDVPDGGAVRTVASRQEFTDMPWWCNVCRPGGERSRK